MNNSGLRKASLGNCYWKEIEGPSTKFVQQEKCDSVDLDLSSVKMTRISHEKEKQKIPLAESSICIAAEDQQTTKTKRVDDDDVELHVHGCRLTYQEQIVTSAEARFSVALRPQKPQGSLGRKAQDGHLDFHTAPEL